MVYHTTKRLNTLFAKQLPIQVGDTWMQILFERILLKLWIRIQHSVIFTAVPKRFILLEMTWNNFRIFICVTVIARSACEWVSNDLLFKITMFFYKLFT